MMGARALTLMLLLGSCSAQSSEPEVLACEEYLLTKIQTPSTYKRIKSFSYREASTQHVSVDYDAQNEFGALVRGKQFCQFPLVGGKPVTEKYIDHDAALVEAAEKELARE